MFIVLLLLALSQEVITVIDGHPVIRVLTKDDIQAIDSPTFEPAERGVRFNADCG